MPLTGPAPADVSAGSPPLLVIEPGPLPIRQYCLDLLHHRDLLGVLAGRDFKLRYRQTVLGVAWVVIQPLLAAAILGFVFGRVAQLDTDGVPSFVFTFAGMTAWSGFSNTMARTTSSLIGNSGLVAKIFFPRLLLPLSATFSVLVDVAINGVILVALAAAGSRLGGIQLLLAPVFVLVLVGLGLGIGSFLASLAVRYRDIVHISPVLLQLGLYASPVAYSVAAVPGRYRTLYYLNPMAGALQGFRWSVFGTSLPPTWALVYATTAALVALVTGSTILERMERGFADVI